MRTWLVCRTPRLNRLGREARVARCDAPESQLATELGETHQECALDRSSILRTSTKDNRALPKGVHVFYATGGHAENRTRRAAQALWLVRRRRAPRGAVGASEATAHSPHLHHTKKSRTMFEWNKDGSYLLVWGQAVAACPLLLVQLLDHLLQATDLALDARLLGRPWCLLRVGGTHVCARSSTLGGQGFAAVVGHRHRRFEANDTNRPAICARFREALGGARAAALSGRGAGDDGRQVSEISGRWSPHEASRHGWARQALRRRGGTGCGRGPCRACGGRVPRRVF